MAARASSRNLASVFFSLSLHVSIPKSNVISLSFCQFCDEPDDLRPPEPRRPKRDHSGHFSAEERRHEGTAEKELAEEDQHGR